MSPDDWVLKQKEKYERGCIQQWMDNGYSRKRSWQRYLKFNFTRQPLDSGGFIKGI